MTLRRFFALSCALFVPIVALAAFDPANMRQKYVFGEPSWHTIGWSGVEVRNVDGVPGDEILIGHSSMWHLLRWDAKAQTFRQLGFYENDVGSTFGGGGLRHVQFAHLEGRPFEVAVLGDSGAIGMFSLDGTERTFWKPPVTNEVMSIRLADFNDKPGDEVLLQTCSELSAWEFGAKTPLWRIPVSRCSSMVLDQLDGDPQLEIALGYGSVIDTKTLREEWRYPIGFGGPLTSGDLDGDGIRDLVGCRGRQCDAFDVARQTNVWETFLPYPEDLGVLTTADVDFDGKAEIFGGDSQHGYIRKLSGTTGEVVSQFSKIGGTNFVAMANLDGDCDLELIWGKDGDNTAIDTFYVTDPVQMKTFWSSIPQQRGSSGIAFADFSGSGRPGLLWASRGGAALRFVDFVPAGRTSQEISVDGGDSYAWRFPVIAAAQLDGDPAVEYVVPVSKDNHLVEPVAVYDGATRKFEWSVVPTPDTITSMTVGDLTGDGVPEIVVGSSILYFPRQHPEAVIAVDGAAKKVLWQTKDELSLLLTQGCDGCIVQVAIHDLDGDGTKEVLALVPGDGLYAYAGRTGELLWHRDALAGAWAFTAADVDASSPGAEIIIPFYGSGRIAVFDATGQKLLRETSIRQKFGGGMTVQVTDLDGDGAKELVVVADAGLLVLSADTLDVLWSGGFVLPWYSLGNQIVIADVDGDGTTEIVVPSAHSLRVFEYRPPTPDGYPPSFTAGAPRAAALPTCCGVSLDWPAASDTESMPVRYRIYRSEIPNFAPDASTLLAQTDLNSYLDRSLFRGHTYFYAVTALDQAGNETTSDPLRATASAPATCSAIPKVRAIRPR